jgi:hypothetical protein
VGLPAEERIVKVAQFSSDTTKENLFPLVIADVKNQKFKYVYEGGKSV